MGAALDVKNFSFSYNKKNNAIEVLQNINLTVNDKEFVSIIGPSGCGKTTLLYSFGGLLNTSQKDFNIKGKSSMVFQDASLLPWRNAEDNIKFGLEIQNKKVNKIGLRKIINLVGLEGFNKFYPHELSGGMKQRVNLARALITKPDIIFMDEPFSSLDEQTRETMQEMLLNIWSKRKSTVIFVTHQISEAAYLSDRVIVLSKRPGKIKKIIDINLPRPRKLDLKLTGKFLEIEKKLWKLIREEGQIEN